MDPASAGVDRVLVDFDETLTAESVAWWVDEREEPDEQMCEYVNDLYADGKTIIIHTARPWSESGKIAARLTEWGVRYHGIRCEKGSADCYIDDKSVRPEEVK